MSSSSHIFTISAMDIGETSSVLSRVTTTSWHSSKVFFTSARSPCLSTRCLLEKSITRCLSFFCMMRPIFQRNYNRGENWQTYYFWIEPPFKIWSRQNINHRSSQVIDHVVQFHSAVVWLAILEWMKFDSILITPNIWVNERYASPVSLKAILLKVIRIQILSFHVIYLAIFLILADLELT